MTTTVFREHEITLNNYRYPIKGPVRSGLISTDPLKIVTADTSRDTHKNLSVISWSNFTRGVGLDRTDGESKEEMERAWYGTTQLRYDRVVLPRLATLTAAGAGSDIGVISEHANIIYAAFGTDFRSYSETTDAWSNVRDLVAAATDQASNIRLNGTVYMVIAQGSDYDYYDGSSWARSDTNVDYLAFWDDRLWGIDSTGQLWYSYSPGTETNDAQLPIENSTITRLFLGYDSDGNSILYAATTRGLYAHDAGNERFVETQLRLPFHPDNGKGADSWQSSMYISAGLAVNQYSIDSDRAVVRPVGPDRDHGLPSNKRGSIVQILPSHNELLILVDAVTAGSQGSVFMSEVPGNSDHLDPDSGVSHIMGWDGLGWESKWESEDETVRITNAHVSNAYNDYRIWWAHNQRVYHMDLPVNIINPTYVTDMAFASSGNLETSDFTGGQSEVDKLAVRLRVEVEDASSDETVIMAFALNGSASYTTLTNTYSSDVNSSGEITSDGKASYHFPSVTAPTGTDFRSIRFKTSLARGNTTTNSPKVLKIDLEWRKKLPALWGHEVVIDLTKPYGGSSSEQMFENLRTAIEANTRSSFSFRTRDANDAGDSNPYLYYVDILGATGIEQSGNNFSGELTLFLAEV